MIFRPELVRKVLEGHKTQTRRRARAGEQPNYTPGRMYAVQPGRGQKAMARILVVDVQRQALGDVTFRDARAEGFRTRDEFFTYWRELHGLGVRAELRDLLERLVDAPATLPVEQLHPGQAAALTRRRLSDLRDRGLAERRGDEWDITDAGVELLVDELEGVDYDQQVWAITFRLNALAVERAVYLTPAAHPAGSTRGYTTRPDQALELVEVVDVGELGVGWQTTSLEAHVDARHGGDLETRLARARELARQRGVDITRLELALRDRITRAAAQDPVRFSVMVERRLRAIESKVYAA